MAEQAGLSLTWATIPEDTFSRDVAQFLSHIINQAVIQENGTLSMQDLTNATFS